MRKSNDLSLFLDGNKNLFRSAYKNDSIFLKYFNQLQGIAISVFEWKNLPEPIDPRFLELGEFLTGKMLFFKDDDVGDYVVAQTTLGGRWDIYNNPIDRRAYATNGLNWNRTPDDSVIIFNNYQRTNMINDIISAAEQLAEIERSITVNAKAQKHPITLVCDENTRLAMKNIYQKYEGNEPVIIVDKKSLGDSKITTLDTGAPYVCDKLYQLKVDIWNEALTMIGVPNSAYQKKERMLSDEVQRLNAGTFASRYSRLMARRDAAKKINEMFNLNIEVNYREYSGGEELKEAETDNGEIHNDSQDDLRIID